MRWQHSSRSWSRRPYETAGGLGESMTAPEDGLEDALRRSLHVALSQVEPGVDGLERIRARTKHHQPQPWLVSVAVGAVDRARHFVWHGHWAWADSFPVLSVVPWPRLRLLPQGTGHVPAHAAPGSRPRRINGIAWMRPAAVLAGVVFIASVALAIPPFRQAIVQFSNTTLTGGHSSGGSGGNGGGSAAGNGTLPGSANRATPVSKKNGASPNVTGAPTCGPTASPSAAATQYTSTGGSSNPTSTTAPGPGSLGGPTSIPTILPPFATTSPTACPSTSAKASPSPTASSQSPSPSTSATSPSSSPSSSSTSPSSTPATSPSSTPSGTAPTSPTPTPTDSGTGDITQGSEATTPTSSPSDNAALSETARGEFVGDQDHLRLTSRLGLASHVASRRGWHVASRRGWRQPDEGAPRPTLLTV